MRGLMLGLALLAACAPAEVVEETEEVDAFCPNLDVSPSHLVFESGPADGSWTGQVEVWDACEGSLVADLMVGGDPAFSLEDDSVTAPEGERAPVGVRFTPGDAELHEGLLLLVVHDGDPVYASIEGQAVADWDGDGHASVPAGGEDCDDDDPARFPGAQEHCDGVDEDCDGEVDEDPIDGQLVYGDRDRDGLGDEAVTTIACDQSPGWSSVAGDCDDLTATVGEAPEGEDCPACPYAHLDAVACTTFRGGYATQLGAESGVGCDVALWNLSSFNGDSMAWLGDQAVWCHGGRAQRYVSEAADDEWEDVPTCSSATNHGSGILVWTAQGSPLRWYADWDHLIDGDHGSTHPIPGVADPRFASTGTEILYLRNDPTSVVVLDRATGELLRELDVDVEAPEEMDAVSWGAGQVVILYAGSELIRLDDQTGEELGRLQLDFDAEALACETGLWGS